MSDLLQLLLLLPLIVLASKGTGMLFLRLGQPAILGEILIGLLLGPTLLNLPTWPLFAGSEIMHGSEPAGVFHTIHLLAEIGVILLMFIAGMETDLEAMKRVGKVALWAAVGGVVLPVVGGVLLSRYSGQLVAGDGFSWMAALFIGTILAATSVSISAQTLLELKQLRSREGTTILGAAVIDDIIGIVLVSIVLAVAAGSGGGESGHGLDLASARALLGSLIHAPTGVMIVLLILFMVAFFAGGWMIGERTFQPLLNRSEAWPTSAPLIGITLVLIFCYAFAAEWFGGVAAITGSYLCGLLIARTTFKHHLFEQLGLLTYGLFVPIFFVNIGLSADARPLFAPFAALAQGGAPNWGPFVFALAICAVAIGAKILGCWGGARYAGFSHLEALRVGMGMVSRGEVGLIIAGLGLSGGLIDQAVFSVMVVMVLVTTLVTPILLKLVFPKPSAPRSAEPEPAHAADSVEALIAAEDQLESARSAP